jgi:serine/threonine-protein kinase
MHELRELSDRYRPIRPLGEGPHSKVFLVEHAGLGRLLALKVLLRAGGAVRRRLPEVLRDVARLDHPNVAGLYDFGLLADSRAYLATEYAAGDTLQRMLHGIPHPAPQAARLVCEAARGLLEVHRRGLVHGAVAASNLGLVRRRERPAVVKLLDVGLAALVRQQVLPQYRAPELRDAPDAPGNPRADIFGLGVMLYELLAGHSPRTDGRTPEPASHRSPPGAPVPRALDELVLRMLSRQPTDRPSADEVVAVLEPVIHIEAPVESTPALPTEVPAGTRGPTILFGKSSPGQQEERRGRLIRELAEAIAEQGGAGAELALASSRVTATDERILQLETELAVVESRVDEDEERFGAREARLRWALVDLCYERVRLAQGLAAREASESGRTEVSPEQIAAEMATIEEELSTLGDERTRDASQLDLEVARRRSDIERERDILAGALEALVTVLERLRPSYASGPAAEVYADLDRVGGLRPQKRA